MALLDMYRQQLEREQRDVAARQRTVADTSSKIASKRREFGRASSDSRRKSLSQEIERLQRRQDTAQQSLASGLRRIAALNEKIARAEANERARTERDRMKSLNEHQRLTKQLNRQLSQTSGTVKDIEDRITQLESSLLVQVHDAVAADPIHREFDVFLSHAGPDAETATNLYNELNSRDLSVWFDGAELRLGESLMRQIDRGIARSKCGVILITTAYLVGREWTDREAGALLGGRRRVIPVLDGVTIEDLDHFSPILRDLVGLSTDRLGFGEIAEKIAGSLS